MDAHIARLCVLYEDLRLELLAITADSIPALDVLDPVEGDEYGPQVGRYRRYYFLRRSIGTLYEFAEGVRLLNSCPGFGGIKAAFDVPTAETWDLGVTFFRASEAAIKNIRNDIGGHFGSKAALYAVPQLSPGAVGTIEIVAHNGAVPSDLRLRFAGEIAAAAFLRHLPGDTDQQKGHNFISGPLMEGYGHATDCVQVVAANYLWDRFGR